jgi:hypothetical protein
MKLRSLPDNCVLARTPEGTRRMRDRSAGLPARLRSVLFLVDGTQTVHRIIGRAGQLGALLEEQLVELLDLGLLEGVSGEMPEACATIALHSPTKGVPIVDAKVRLLESLERLEGGRMKQHGSALVEARSWRDLATRTRDLSVTIRDSAGPDAATRFWSEAKQILVACRGQEVEGVRS